MPFTVGSMFGSSNAVRGTVGKTQSTAVACSCPACTGLQCLDRPRFFAGQLLSEAELNSEMGYVLAKQRLHNRYLHGVGTVCGLEVVCSNCDNLVVVKPGYAIDPCGNDIIVCSEQQFDVLKAIKACCDAINKKSKTGCDPYAPYNEGCTGQEQRWCITIAYQETPTMPVTPLRPSQQTCSCAGSCSPVSSCGCSPANGNGSAPSSGCSAPSSSTTTATASACQPTRIQEGFVLGVVPDPESCATTEALFQNTLLANLVNCFSVLTNLQSNFSTTTWQILSLAFTSSLANSQTLNSDAFLACCQFRQYVINLFTTGDFTTECTALNAFDSIPCPQPPQDPNDPTDAGYLQKVQDSIASAEIMLFEYVRECMCDAILPSCPSDPGDDRLILACVTVQDGTITEICNFGCRQFAGAFPSFFYWMSLIPIAPLLKLLVDDFCCMPTFLKRNSQLVNNLQTIDPAGLFTKAISDGNFALPRMVMDRLGDVVQKASLQGIISSIPASGLNLATLRGMSVQNAQEALKRSGVTFEEQQVNSRADIPLFPQAPTAFGALLMPFAQRGDHVVLFESAGAVLEVQRSGATSSPGTSDITNLQTQVAQMQADIAALKAAATQGKKK